MQVQVQVVVKTARTTDTHTSLKTNMIKQRHKKCILHRCLFNHSPLFNRRLSATLDSIDAHRDVNDTLLLTNEDYIFKDYMQRYVHLAYY